MHPLIAFYMLCSLCFFLQTVGHALAAKALGADIEEICFFGGPTLARINRSGILWIVKLVPGLGGHVKSRAKSVDDFSSGFNDLHPLRRIMIYASGSLALAAVALACLGPVEGARSVWHGFREIVRGGLAPVTIGAPLVRSLFELIRVGPFTASLGVIAAKVTAFSLLPLLPLNGGHILWILADRRARLSERIALNATVLGLFAILILDGGWLYASARVLMYG